MTIHQLLLYLRTAQHLKVSQLFYFLVRRHYRSRLEKTTSTPGLRVSSRIEVPCAVRGIYKNDTTFRFLNVDVDLLDKQGKIDWSARSQSRLWQYNLHYFDFLREDSRPDENKSQLIQSWIEENPQGSEPGWEPFTTSLRLVNWVLYFRQRPADSIPANWLESLFLQSRWLEKKDERHILANHYFENLKALFFAGCFFTGKDATRWLKRTLVEIPEQIREQTLPDGGHYERSHMYHCLMLENHLDIYNFAQSYQALCPAEFFAQVHLCAKQSLEWLSHTVFPDGEIPLFNDSAFAIASSPKDIWAYAERLCIDTQTCGTDDPRIIDQSSSGYYGCRIGDDMFLIDCGDIGPDYQPGHTHCDFLSYELMLGRRRIIVDTGVCEYAPGQMRQYVRSTKAHNTVSIDGDEQSEIWGEFRVARRAKKINATITWTGQKVRFRGAYRGFYKIGGRIEHHRNVAISISDSGQNIETVIISDTLIGSGIHAVESYVHFHPELVLQRSDFRTISLYMNGIAVASLQVPADHELKIEPSVYCPEFGKQLSNQVLVISKTATLPVTLNYTIRNQKL
jgi:uncharacterized heparinase superfamily protein